MEISSEKIQAYLHDQLTDVEKQAFEELLKSNPEIAQETREALLIKEGLALEQDVELMQRIERLEASLENKKSSNTWIRWAAAILILAIPVYYFSSLPSSPEELYKEYYSPYENVIGATRGDNAGNYLLSYDHGNYKDAVVELSEAIEVSENPQDYYLYLGISYLELDDYQNAIETFSKIESTNRFANHSKWYGALTYLKMGDENKAKEVLKELKESEGSFSKQAEEILESLD